MTTTTTALDFIDQALEAEGKFRPAQDAPLSHRALHLIRRENMARRLTPCGEHFDYWRDWDEVFYDMPIYCSLPEGHGGDHHLATIAGTMHEVSKLESLYMTDAL